MKEKIMKLLIKFILLTSLYNAALGVWGGTIYLFMKHITIHMRILIFFGYFWGCDFLLSYHLEFWQINLAESMCSFRAA